MRRAPFLVVGAGPQGLTFALAAARRGRSVVVVDKAPAVGGQARSIRYGGFVFDLGMHALVARDERVLALARECLGRDYASFRPRAGSWLSSGKIVDDVSVWRHAGSQSPLCRLLPAPQGEPWSCMRIQEPPGVVYPRRGGFGALFERMARLLERAGGRLVLNQPVDPVRFDLAGGRLISARVGGRDLRVAGCYWAAGAAAFRAPESGAAEAGLVLHHFLLRGRAPLHYHWVRVAAESPFLPPLAYYPARFGADNAPAGCYSLGAAVPAPAPSREASSPQAAVLRWHREDPEAFAPMVRRFLCEQGFMREGQILEQRHERMPVPVGGAPKKHPLRSVSNFSFADDWACERSGESAVAMQMSAALDAAGELFEAAS